MAKVTPVEVQGTIVGYYFDCPGCLSGHIVTVSPNRAENGASWKFNGDLNRPTFNPSIMSRWQFNPEINKPDKVCYLFVTDGMIRFLGDCTHPLKGRAVDMTDTDFGLIKK